MVQGLKSNVSVELMPKKNAIPVMASRGRPQIDVHEKMNLLLYLFINLNLT